MVLTHNKHPSMPNPVRNESHHLQEPSYIEPAEIIPPSSPATEATITHSKTPYTQSSPIMPNVSKLRHDHFCLDISSFSDFDSSKKSDTESFDSADSEQIERIDQAQGDITKS
ncbi:hypothetical protein AMTR_s00032p00238720 [Amborella trichopoda]|uniref:Uncharacterized protein n=1 Tax=Amborella trichopoda TaxID=13333 RepID=U5CYL1_AMBTC|nr:hypothetical protein AMTR_s00032p00238720 [Amborella trichopoda]